MSYKNYALQEFRAAGWIDENGKYCCDEMQEAVCNDLLALLETFSKQGHSGTSASYTLSLFQSLANFKPIAPLTGEDWEWNEICDDRTGGVTVFQNKRCGSVFKQSDRFDGKPYDIDAVAFWEWHTDSETGERYKSYFQSSDSIRPIEFPYTPTTIYMESVANGDDNQ